MLLTFHREVTTTKKEITADQRLCALEILQRIVYSQSSEAYDAVYQELCDLDLEHVTNYFDVNWHPIRDEWTLHGRNKYVNFLTTTNNRTERLNRTFKEIGNRYSNLLIFFENLTTSVAVIASERYKIYSVDNAIAQKTIRGSSFATVIDIEALVKLNVFSYDSLFILGIRIF